MKIVFTLLLLTLSISTAFAQETASYVPMVGVPGLQNAGNLSAQQYIEALYKLSITVGSMLAVIQIIFAGVQYMLTDVITSKSDAIKRIRGALFGLLILVSAVLILQTINPKLLNLNIFNNAPPLETINGGQNPSTLAPAKVGDRVNSNDAAKVENLKNTCRGTIVSVAIPGTSNSMLECTDTTDPAAVIDPIL